MRQSIGIEGVLKYKETVVEVLKHKVEPHIEYGYQKIVPAFGLRKVIATDSGDGGKYRIEERHLKHGHRNVAGRLESEAPVKGKVPKHGQYQSD